MLNLNDIRSPLIKGLKAFTGNTVIMADQTGKAPAYPYYTIKFTLLGDTVGQVSETAKDSVVSFEQVSEMTVSISAYSDKLDQSFNDAFKALEWFKGIGAYALGDENIVVVRTHPITNRDTFMTVEYERRHGFDVDLRVKTRSSYDVGYIEHVETVLKEEL